MFDNKQLLTTETVADLLGISSKAVSLWLENGVLVEKYADNQVKVLEESVQKILNIKARLKNLKINASQHMSYSKIFIETIFFIRPNV